MAARARTKPKPAARKPLDVRAERAAIVGRVCDILASTPRSLREICEQEEGVPPLGTLLRWRDAEPDLVEQYARAREHQAELLESEIQRVAEDGSRDYLLSGDGVAIGVNHEHVQRSRLIVDTLKWRMARMHQRRYGDKVELSGSAEAPLRVIVTEE